MLFSHPLFFLKKKKKVLLGNVLHIQYMCIVSDVGHGFGDLMVPF